MQYPLPERIGDPDLFVGREAEFRLFGKWLKGIPKRISKSRAILARRKSGKTAFVQRIFNMLWSENGQVIPFYMNFPERNVWFPDFAIEYYCTFVSHYISFLERDEEIVKNPLTPEQIREYGVTKSVKYFVTDIDRMLKTRDEGSYDLTWQIAHTAPHRYAGISDRRFLVILDEFQNIGSYIYRDRECRNCREETLAGSWHEYSESKIAPMLVTGSYVGFLLNLISTYLEAGRLKLYSMPPYLTEEEGLQAVYKYSEFYEEDITNEAAVQINHLCMSDPFFISCVIGSDFVGKDLTTKEGVVGTANYEITDRNSEMSKTWGEYIELTLKRVNDIHAKSILLHLSRYPDREWTPKELKEALKLELGTDEIHKRLRILVSADVIAEGTSDIDYHGLRDGTLNLILRKRFEKEIGTFEPDLKKEFGEELEKLRKDRNRLRGKLNYLIGKFAEYQLVTDFRHRKRFPLSQYFEGVSDDTVLCITDARLRVVFQRSDGKNYESDVLAESACGRVVLVEVKKTQAKIGFGEVEYFLEKTEVYAGLFPEKKVLTAFLSVGGFTDEAIVFCKEHGIGTAESIEYYQEE